MRYYVVQTEKGYQIEEVAAGAWEEFDKMYWPIIVGMSRSLAVAWLVLNAFRAEVGQDRSN
jgi:hypothetical protein